VNRATPPPDLPMRPSHLPIPDAHTLPNGVRVLTLPDRRAPVVEFRLVLPFAGRAYDDPNWVGLASATARLMSRGHADPHQLRNRRRSRPLRGQHRRQCEHRDGDPQRTLPVGIP
jgi:predicted Zn-dependent peptidase